MDNQKKDLSKNPVLTLVGTFRIGVLFVLIVICPMLQGCSILISNATEGMAESLYSAVIDNNDPETVESGAPAYLLMIDGLIKRHPDNIRLLQTGSKLYTAYALVFVSEPVRVKKMTDKALDYGLRAICLTRSDACNLIKQDFASFSSVMAEMKTDDLPSLFSFATAWAGRIQAHKDDLSAVARLSRVKLTMQRIIELDDAYADGACHMYMGIFETLLPPALGGKPEQGRQYFERALSLSQGKNLGIKVAFARHYARLVFDRELHDRLLHDVLNADPEVEGFTLMNILAQREARQLLESAGDYF